MDGLKLATLDTLQHRLARDAESADRLTHRQESFASFTVKAGLELGGEPDAPGRTGRDLLASDDAVIDETMNGRGCDADLDSLTETEIEQEGKRFIVRGAPRPAASLALHATGVALPPTVRETAAD
jgi:hypothetical protein